MKMVVHFYFTQQKIRKTNVKIKQKKYLIEIQQDLYMEKEMNFILLKIAITIKLAFQVQLIPMNCLMEFKRTLRNQMNIQDEHIISQLQKWKYTKSYDFIFKFKIIKKYKNF